MLITDQFVMLNFPKTGTTFVRDVLVRIHEQRAGGNVLRKLCGKPAGIQKIEVPNIDASHKRGAMTAHGTFRQIPEAHRHKKVVSITRDPVSRYTSLYLFQVRKKQLRHPPAEAELLKQSFPSFPDLSFAEYYDMIQQFGCEGLLKGIKPKVELGSHSIKFIPFYFRDPEKVLREIDHDYIASERFREDMADVTFLHQETLNAELAGFLLKNGYSEEECALIDKAEKLNESKRSGNEKDHTSFYEDGVLERMRERDALLFKIFPAYLPDV